MNNLERCSLLIVDLVLAFGTASVIATVVLLLATAIGNPRPLLWAWRAGVVTVVATFVVAAFAQGAWRGAQ